MKLKTSSSPDSFWCFDWSVIKTLLASWWNSDYEEVRESKNLVLSVIYKDDVGAAYTLSNTIWSKMPVRNQTMVFGIIRRNMDIQKKVWESLLKIWSKSLEQE